MDRTDFSTHIRKLNWQAVVEMQGRVMKVVNALGASTVIWEVDLKPAEGSVIIYGSYKERRLILTYSDGPPDGALCLNVEMLVGDIPERLPSKFINATEKLLDECDVRHCMRGEGIFLELSYGAINTAEDLDCALQHVLEHAKAMEVLLNDEDADPLEGEPAAPKPQAQPGDRALN